MILKYKERLIIILAVILLAGCSPAEEIREYAEDTREYIKVPVLMYHHLVSSDDEVTSGTIVSVETFESHIKALADNGYTGISFEQLVSYVENNRRLPEKPAIITFDDGYLSNYEIAYPILKRYDMKAAIFIIGIAVGQTTYRDTGDENFPILPRFSYEQANEMIASGLIEIQSHSYDMHQWEEYEKLLGGEYRRGILPLEHESEEDYTANFRKDYKRAKSELEAAIRTESIAYAYPFGLYSELSEQLLKEMGVKVTLTTHSGNNIIKRGEPETLYLLNRFTIDNMSVEKLLETLEVPETATQGVNIYDTGENSDG